MTVQTTQLPSGLTVVSDAMPHLETVSVGVWVGAGSRNERPQEHGIAHFLEHMAFKGTQRRSARDIAEEIEQVGADLNAHTSHESTAYHARALSGDLELSVDLLSDILLHSQFEEEELERERNVILQEIRQVADTPDDLVFDEFLSVAYADQPLGRPILGTPSTVESFDRDHLQSYLRGHYHAPACVLAAAGDVEHDRLVALAERYLVELPSGNAGLADPAIFRGGEFRKERDLEQAHLVLGFEGVPQTDDMAIAAKVFSGVLGGGMSSRLFQELRERRGLCYSVFSFAWSFFDSGILGVYAATDEDNLEELSFALVNELAGMADSVTEKEIARAKAQAKAGLLMGLENSSARAEHLARQIMVYGKPWEVSELVEQIDAVDANAIKTFASEMISRSAPALAAYGPISTLPHYNRLFAGMKG